MNHGKRENGCETPGLLPLAEVLQSRPLSKSVWKSLFGSTPQVIFDYQSVDWRTLEP